MPRIVFRGRTRRDDPILEACRPRPAGAKTLPVPANIMTSSLVFALPFFLLCFAALFGKRARMDTPPLAPAWGPVGILLGLLGCFVHELLHALPQPRDATAYIGFVPARFLFYMKCAAPVPRNRFVLSSLLPMALGALPLLAFLLSPSPRWNAVLWPMAMIGFVSPSPDYAAVCRVLRAVPRNAWIQDDPEGFCWFFP